MEHDLAFGDERLSIGQDVANVDLNMISARCIGLPSQGEMVAFGRSSLVQEFRHFGGSIGPAAYAFLIFGAGRIDGDDGDFTTFGHELTHSVLRLEDQIDTVILWRIIEVDASTQAWMKEDARDSGIFFLERGRNGGQSGGLPNSRV